MSGPVNCNTNICIRMVTLVECLVLSVSDAGKYENVPQTLTRLEPVPCVVLRKVVASGKQKEKRLVKMCKPLHLRKSQCKGNNTNGRTTLEDAVNILTEEDKKETITLEGGCTAKTRKSISIKDKNHTEDKARGQLCNKELLDDADMDLLLEYRKERDKQSEKPSLWSAMSSGVW